MIASIAGAANPATTELGTGGDSDKLREASEQLEGIFVQFLTKALRSTIPDGGNPDAPGADLYSSLLDEHLAQVVANDTRTGIAEALYRQFTALAQDSPREGSDV